MYLDRWQYSGSAVCERHHKAESIERCSPEASGTLIRPPAPPQLVFGVPSLTGFGAPPNWFWCADQLVLVRHLTGCQPKILGRFIWPHLGDIRSYGRPRR